MRLSVFGCGYLGAVHAVCLAELGHSVVGIDILAGRVADLSAGVAPFFEPGFEDLLHRGIGAGRLRFTTEPEEALGSAVHFLCVGTPQRPDGPAADLRDLDAAVESLIGSLRPGDVVVGKSTVPVGTAERVADRLREAAPGAELVWNPEFLREGRAVHDSLGPDRLVYGYADSDAGRRARDRVDEVYAGTLGPETPRVDTDLATAQLVKVAANSFLATKVSFINAMAELCEASGADVTLLAEAIGHDPRIGRSYLNAGIGFGGGCLPKDIRAFMARADELGVDQALGFLREVDRINARRRARMVDLAREELGGSFVGRSVAVLGAAFKPDSDDVRDSPAMDIAAQIVSEGAKVTVTDPRAVPNARRKWPHLAYADSVEEACRGAELVMVLTEWPAFVELEPSELKQVVAAARVIDGRTCLDADRWRAAGWHFRALGRP